MFELACPGLPIRMIFGASADEVAVVCFEDKVTETEMGMKHTLKCELGDTCNKFIDIV